MKHFACEIVILVQTFKKKKISVTFSAFLCKKNYNDYDDQPTDMSKDAIFKVIKRYVGCVCNIHSTKIYHKTIFLQRLGETSR